MYSLELVVRVTLRVEFGFLSVSVFLIDVKRFLGILSRIVELV